MRGDLCGGESEGGFEAIEQVGVYDIVEESKVRIVELPDIGFVRHRQSFETE